MVDEFANQGAGVAAWRGCASGNCGGMGVSYRAADRGEHAAGDAGGRGTAECGAEFWECGIYKGRELG